MYTHIGAVCMYNYKHVHTYQMWVNEVFLDRRMTILHFFCILWHFLLIMGRSIIFHCFFVILTMCFIIFHCFFPNYMVQPKVILPPWWKDMDFKKKPGRHSNLIYLVWNPLKNSGTAFGDLSVFWRCCSLLFSVFCFEDCFHWI